MSQLVFSRIAKLTEFKTFETRDVSDVLPQPVSMPLDSANAPTKCWFKFKAKEVCEQKN